MFSVDFYKYFSKFLLKCILLKIQSDYTFWKKIGLFDHGQMNEIKYASSTFEFFYDTYVRVMQKDFSNITLLELGPGDSVANGILAFNRGAKCSILVDVGDFATRDVTFYSELVTGKQRAYESITNFPEILTSNNIEYFTDGLESINHIPQNSIDLVISNAVLEHIDPESLSAFLAKVTQLLTPGGIMIHRIDYRDHLVGSNFHKLLPSWIIKSYFYKKSILYLNGFTEQQYSQLFVNSGFSISIIDSKKFPSKYLRNNGEQDLDLLVSTDLAIASSCFICINNPEN